MIIIVSIVSIQCSVCACESIIFTTACVATIIESNHFSIVGLHGLHAFSRFALFRQANLSVNFKFCYLLDDCLVCARLFCISVIKASLR